MAKKRRKGRLLEEAAAILGTSVETIERKAERLEIKLKRKRPKAKGK